MDARQQRGLEIAAMSKITKRGNETWIVPSQSLNGKYAVTVSEEGRQCTCPDFELRQQPCKHVFAVEYVIKRESVTETKPDGTVSTTTTETTGVRVTYSQNWPAYNAAQTTEKDEFCRLLKDLVAGVPTPAQAGAGRRRTPLPDLIFASAYKVYSGFSSRRFMSDLRAARDDGLVGHAAAFNSIYDVMQEESLTPILHDLIAITAKPLATVESQFAVDSTGLGTECFYRHYSAKYGHDQMNRDYVKVHAMIGTKTNVITAVAITDRDAHDAPQFPALVNQTAEDFFVCEVSGDKAYASVKNLTTVSDLGATPFVPFKSNSVGNSDSPLWNKLWHYFQFNKDEFLPHYHRRSNVESTFSMIKRVIGDTLRSKTRVAQINEALLMILCHNIRCLIHEMFELGINPAF
ncbi:MAG: transposase [Candidatus Binatia bacterium]